MKECEIYSERIAIMVRGELKCLGSPEHIKEKYGLGYELKLYCSPESFHEIKSLISVQFRNVTFNDSLSYLSCLIPIKSERIYEIFSLIMMIKSLNCELEYTINQTSLENVFRYFSNEIAT
uniref:ATP-binding cassette sub-family A member 13 (Trinotate prediction) n=1 Tax=Henneguya salminicola TaxID=69463 RepID=A0A6G3MIU7_HENSL